MAFSGAPNEDLVAHGLAEGGMPTIASTGDTATFEYVREIAADDVVAVLQVSTDLSNWTDGSSTFTLQDSQYLGTGGLRMRFEAPRSTLDAPRHFLRLSFQLVE